MTRCPCLRVLALAALSVAVVSMTAHAQPPRGGRGGPGGFMGRRGGGFLAGPGAGGLIGLVANPQVQEELKLSDGQKEKVQELRRKLGEEMRELFGGRQGGEDLTREQRMARFQERMERFRKEAEKRAPLIEKQIAGLLEPAQFKRLKQLELQRQGVDGLIRPDIAQALGLSEDQQQEIRSVIEERDRKRRELGEQMQGLFQGDFRQRSEQERRQLREKMEGFGQKRRALDSDAQKKAMAVLTSDQKAKLPDLMGQPFEFRPPEGRRGGGFGRPGQGRPGQGRRPRRPGNV